MKEMGTSAQYAKYKKPKWAPRSSVFGPVWTLLYILIGVSFGYVGYLYLDGAIMWCVALPFALNIILNLAYSPLQFAFKSLRLATADVLLVLGTLVWALCVVSPYAMWVVYINLPYLAWVFFASVLQVEIYLRNKKSR